MVFKIGLSGVSTVATWATFIHNFNHPVEALTCYCLGHCHPHSDNSSLVSTEAGGSETPTSLGDVGEIDAGDEGSWCLAKPGARCFSAVEQVYDPGTASLVPERTYGCLPPDERGLLQCKGNLVPHLNPTAIACCSDQDYCNKRLAPMYETEVTSSEGGDGSLFGGSGSGLGQAASLALLVSLTLCFVLLVVFVTFMYLRFKKREDKEKKSKQRYHRTAMSDPDVGALFGGSSSGGGGFGNTLSELIEQSSGSGSGLPLLVQRTIAKQIHMLNPVGKGRYGEVWLAKWRGESVAVKVFFTTDEASWFRETEIYQTVLMRHENILGFIAADIRGTGGCTQMLLITDYHQNGSLYDYLKYDEIDEEQMIALAHSAASGISHLHTEIAGTRPKPAIAHRDIKSRNILVKRDLTCAIADFGLAVRFDSNSNEVDIGAPNTRVGTIRYMAPEILNQTVNAASFESFKQSDMYSFGLVLWEICRRTRPSTVSQLKAKQSEKIESYSQSINSINKFISEETSCELPFYEYVGSDPSFDEMQSVVVGKKLRPCASSHWHSSESLSTVYRLMKECWHDNPSARLSMLRVKKSLLALKQSTIKNPQPLPYHPSPTGNPQQLQVNKHHSSSVDSTTKLKSSMPALSSGVNSCCSSDILPISPSPEVNRCHQQQQPPRQFNNGCGHPLSAGGSTGSASSYTPSVTSQCSDKPQIAAPAMAGVPVSAKTAPETTAVNIAL